MCGVGFCLGLGSGLAGIRFFFVCACGFVLAQALARAVILGDTGSRALDRAIIW